MKIRGLHVYFTFFSLNFLFFAVSLTTSCTSENVDDCFSNTGVQITKTRTVAGFNKIELYDNVNLVLVPGISTEIEVEAGKNIIDAIKTEISDSTLVIRNTMECNWVRNFNREITVFVSANNLKEIRYEGSGDVSNIGQLSLDSLYINIRGGAGSFNFDVNIHKLNLSMHYGTADIHVRGKSMITTIVAGGFGPFYCNDLISNIVYISSGGSNDCYIHAVHILESKIFSVGNIYYTGNPYRLESTVLGSGKLIKLD